MPDISIKYEGNLRTTATHLKSGSIISTDAPTDNKGKGENFSPTDLFATALGSCMLTIMGITAQAHGLSIDGSNIEIDKRMGKNPRRVSYIKIIINNKIVRQYLYNDINDKFIWVSIIIIVNQILSN